MLDHDFTDVDVLCPPAKLPHRVTSLWPRTDWARGFLCGLAASASAVVTLLFIYIGVTFGGGYETKPGFRDVRRGMTLARVRHILGAEDGVLSGRTMDEYHRWRWGEARSEAYQSVERQGGRILFWLSRSKGLSGDLLIFNVVTFDNDDRVTSTDSGYDTYFGM